MLKRLTYKILHETVGWAVEVEDLIVMLRYEGQTNIENSLYSKENPLLRKSWENQRKILKKIL